MSSIDGGGGTVRRTMDFVGLITAKGRSRGLRGKNTADLCGKPLVAWSIDAAMASRMISAVFVSTENEQIKGISKRLGAYVIPRPHDLCGDSTTSDEVIAHAIPCIMESREDANVGIVLLQPTSPLRTADDIDMAIQAYADSDAKALVSVVLLKSHMFKACKLDADGYLVGAFSPDAPYQPRQSLPRIFMPNGAIYIFSAAEFLKAGCIPRSKVLAYAMSSERSIDIDCQVDLDVARRYLEETRSAKQR